MKAMILLTLCLNTAFAGGVNEGGTAGGSGTGARPVVQAMNSDETDIIEAGKKCLSFYTAEAAQKEMTVEELKKAILAEVNKDQAPKAKSVGRSIASVEDVPSKKTTSMECHLFAKDTGDKAFLNQLVPTEFPTSTPAKTQESRATGTTR